MANLWEMITGLKDRIGNKNPQLIPYQFADNGELDVDRTLQLSMQQPRTLGQHLLGREVGVDVDTTNPEDKTATTERVAKFQPGFFNDLRSGANENFVTGFAANNLTDNMANGRKKGFAYRLGEGLGSLARFGESPLGRGLLMAGIVGATGGSGLQALAYGAGTGVGNQANRMRDNVYRDDLIRGEQETIMGSEGFDKLDPTTKQMLLNDAANRVNNYRGYITNDVYRNMVDSRIARENAAYRKMFYDQQALNQRDMMEYRKNQLEYQKRQDVIQNALRARGLDIQEQRATNSLNKLSSKDLTTYRDNLSTLKDINAGLELIEKNPKAYSLVKGALPAWATNRLDPQGIATRTQIDNITAVYRKWLTGAQMSDAERKAYERFLPAPTDNYETVKAKLQGMRDSIERKNSILMQGANDYQQINDVPQDSLGIL